MSENDLAHHYKVLKQFLDISDDLNTRTKTNSTRAVRAREKLLKLLAAQFKELSTDVYDELKRRIDESRGEPDFLLPKSTFHPKRNQARQKLSSLPQSRFKDLVSDISYEIYRRDLHVAPVSTESPAKSVATAKTDDILPETDVQTTPNGALNPVKQSPASNDVHNQTIGVQSKTVVPTKANLTWSSDEEDENDDEPATTEKTVSLPVAQEPIQAQNADIVADLRAQLQDAHNEKLQLEAKYNALHEDYDYSNSQNRSLSLELDSLAEEKKAWDVSRAALQRQIDDLKTRAPASNEADLQSEIESLKATNAALRLGNQSLRNTSKEHLRSASRELIGGFSDANGSDIKKELASFYDKLAHLETLKPPQTDQNDLAQLRKDVSLWQKRYEDSRSTVFSAHITRTILGSEELKSFITPMGLVSIKLVADLQALVESFILYISQDRFDSDILFEKISKISIIANEIATQGDNQHLNSNENSITLREATSHALTATRYYATYSSILPRIVVERALGEVCFTLCDLVTVSKLNSGSENNRAVDNAAFNSVPKQSRISSEDITSGVRPLRMANKLKDSYSQQNGSPVSSGIVTPTEEKTKASPAPEPSKTTSNGIAMSLPSFLRKDNVKQTVQIPSATTSAPVPAVEAKVVSNLPDDKKTTASNGKSASPRSIGQGISQLTSKLNNSPGQVNKTSPRTTPTKLGNILDRVKQFESPTEERVSANSSPKRTPKRLSLSEEQSPIYNRSNSFEKPKESLANPFEAKPSNGANGATSLGAAAATAATAAAAATGVAVANKDTETGVKGKGIFQSIRDRFVPETDSKLQAAPGVGESSDNDKALKSGMSTAETTPAKDTDTENDDSFNDTQETTPSNRDNSFFKSVRNRLTPPDHSEANSSVTPSSGTSDVTIQNDDKAQGSPGVGRNRSINHNVKASLVNIQKHKVNMVSVDKPSSENGSPHPIGSNNQADNRTSPVTFANKPATAKVSPLNMANKLVNDTVSPLSNASKVSPLSIASKVSPLSIASRQTNDKISTSPVVVPTKKVNIANDVKTYPAHEAEVSEDDDASDSDASEVAEARQRQEYRKSMAAATFNIDLFDIDDPDNTLTQVLLYLEHQTVQVISTIQSLLSAIKRPNATRGDLIDKSRAITVVISQMTEATNTSMNQTRNFQLKEHGSWVVTSLEDCNHRMNILAKPNSDKSELDFADKNFKQRLAGISFDIAKCTKELVKTVEEASLKEDIAHLDARLSHGDDLT